ncbi:hypothetical protein PR048_025770 [Dryococelus australis]|uniref:Uncharacterized protein n=1 Tax=Dryococelus australis TaxID=614101 RepID=A0ABQ9GJI5_9NEOP|nr:hypothetical protein PR048_025770 [Dryococelus australis]
MQGWGKREVPEKIRQPAARSPHFKIWERPRQESNRLPLGRGGPIAWPARSPGLTPLDYFLWGHMKGVVYQTSVEVLLAWIRSATDLGLPGIGDRVYQNMVRRYRVCVDVSGRHIEPLLFVKANRLGGGEAALPAKRPRPLGVGEDCQEPRKRIMTRGRGVMAAKQQEQKPLPAQMEFLHIGSRTPVDGFLEGSRVRVPPRKPFFRLELCSQDSLQPIYHCDVGALGTTSATLIQERTHYCRQLPAYAKDVTRWTHVYNCVIFAIFVPHCRDSDYLRE